MRARSFPPGQPQTDAAEPAGQRAAVALLLADVLAGWPRAEAVAGLASREAFAPLLAGADPAAVAARLRAERARLWSVFGGVPGASPGPGLGLRRLSRLAQAEADALAGDPDHVLESRATQIDLLRRGILPWVIPFCPALERNAQESTLRLVAEQAPPFLLAQLDSLSRLPRARPRQRRAAPPHPPLPSDGTPIERLIATPALGGVALSRDDVARLARLLGLPEPSGGPFAAVMQHLFQAAREHGRLPDLRERLARESRARADRYAQWGLLYEAAAGLCWDWRERASVCVRLLDSHSATC